jgi:negative regulator of genetic competence, sporulation and motility
VYPFEGDQPPAVLYEFGRDLGQCTYLEAHLAEQGDVLIPDTAIANLRMHFVQ